MEVTIKNVSSRVLLERTDNGVIIYDVNDLVPGTYAIALIHDENDNQRLDTGLFGIPKEGFCFSSCK